MRSDQRIPLSVPFFGGNEWKYVKECLDTGWVSSAGPFVTRFEQEVAAYVDAPHAVALVNGTAALHIALLVAGVRPDDEVLVADLTFVAPVNTIRYCQAHPVFMDMHAGTWQLDVDKVARFLAEECEMRGGECVNRRTGRRVRAIVPVHLFGLVADVDRLVEVARRHAVRVVEDASEGLGVRYRGRHVGTFGDVGTFSFNGNKIMTTGGGGILVTHDAETARHARYLTNQAKDDALEGIHHTVGYNYRLTNLHAALGIAQLEQMPDFVAKKRAIARAYREALRDVAGVTSMPEVPGADATYWLYTILLAAGTTVERRKQMIAALGERGVETRPIFHPMHALRPYRECQAYRIEHAPDLYARGISLPSSVGLGAEDQRRCIAIVKETLGA